MACSNACGQDSSIHGTHPANACHVSMHTMTYTLLFVTRWTVCCIMSLKLFIVRYVCLLSFITNCPCQKPVVGNPTRVQEKCKQETTSIGPPMASIPWHYGQLQQSEVQNSRLLQPMQVPEPGQTRTFRSSTPRVMNDSSPYRLCLQLKPQSSNVFRKTRGCW